MMQRDQWDRVHSALAVLDSSDRELWVRKHAATH